MEITKEAVISCKTGPGYFIACIEHPSTFLCDNGKWYRALEQADLPPDVSSYMSVERATKLCRKHNIKNGHIEETDITYSLLEQETDKKYIENHTKYMKEFKNREFNTTSLKEALGNV